MVVAGRPSGTALTPRRFPPPWTAEHTPHCFIVRDANGAGRTVGPAIGRETLKGLGSAAPEDLRVRAIHASRQLPHQRPPRCGQS